MNVQINTFGLKKLLKAVLLSWLLLGLLFLPVVYWVDSPVRFEVPKVRVTLVWIAGLIMLSINQLNNLAESDVRADRWPDFLISILLVSLGLIAGVSSWIGSDWTKSLIGNYYRLDGLITLFHLLSFSLILQLVWQVEWRVKLVQVGAWSASLVSLLVIGLNINNAAVGLNWHRLFSVPSIPFGQPNFLAGFLVVVVPTVILSRQWACCRWQKLGWSLALGTVILCIGVTQSRGGLLVLVLLPVFWLVSRLKSARLQILVALFGCFFLVVGFWLGWSYRQPHLLSPESRATIFKRLAMGVADKPLLGWGWANVNYAFASNQWPTVHLHDIHVDKAHSSFLEWLVTTGVVGFGMYASLVALTILRIESRLTLIDAEISKLSLSFSQNS